MSDDRYIQQMTAQQRQRAGNRYRKKRRERNQRCLARLLAFFLVVVGFTVGFLLLRTVVRHVTGDEGAMETVLDEKVNDLWKPKIKKVTIKPPIIEDFIEPNEYSRPQELLLGVSSLFVHYTANADTTARQNRSYFQGLAVSHETSASAHFIIGYDGEIIQCIPFDEIAYAVKGRNYDSISIECCYLDESGKFTDATYKSLIELLAWLMGRYDLTVEDVLRHYDEGGKNCPKYYVENEQAWNILINDLIAYIERYGVYEEELTDEEQLENEGKESGF